MMFKKRSQGDAWQAGWVMGGLLEALGCSRKAVGLAKFADLHGGLFGRIQLIRKQSSAGGEYFARLEINQAATIKKLLLITSNPQLDDFFAAVSK